jgi:hypothetical protein
MRGRDGCAEQPIQEFAGSRRTGGHWARYRGRFWRFIAQKPLRADAGLEVTGLQDAGLQTATARGYLSRNGVFLMDDKTRIELEAAVYRRLVDHLRQRTDVQNIDMMNLAGFCRNCLSNWMKDAADAKGIAMSKDESREIVYGEPFEQWKAKHQKEASADQKAAFAKSAAHNH